MFNTKFLILTVFVSFVFTACQKEQLNKVNGVSSPADALVKTKTEAGKTETYYYDNAKRLSKIVFTSAGTAPYYHEFTYTATTVFEYKSEEPRYALEETQSNGTIKFNYNSNPVEYKLNDKGFYIGLNTIYQTQNFEYDKYGFIKKQVFDILDYAISEEYSNNGKNVETISGKGVSYMGGTFNTSTVNEYLTDKTSSIGNKNFGKSFLGKSSENLLKSSVKDSETTTYTYQFDAEQRVTQQTQLKGTTQTIITYTYY